MLIQTLQMYICTCTDTSKINFKLYTKKKKKKLITPNKMTP